MPAVTRDDIIKEALGPVLGVLRIGSTLSSTQIAICAPILNTLISSWQHYFLESWPSEEGVLFLSADRSHYTLGNENTICALNPIQLPALKVSTSVVNVSNTEELTADQNIVLVSDTARHITTIDEVSTSTNILLTDAMPADFEPLRAFVYDEEVESIVRIISANDTATNCDITVCGKKQYDQQVYPGITGDTTTVINLYRGKDKTIVKCWMPPFSNGVAVRFNFMRPIESMASGSTVADIPEEWKLALVLQLALLVHRSFGVNISQSSLPSLATNALAMARLGNTAGGSAFLNGEDC